MKREPQSIVFVSMENWDDIWRRNQFICAELARRMPERKILFVGLPIDVSNAVRRMRFKDLGWAPTVAVKGLANLLVTRPLKLLPDTFSWGRSVNQAMFRRHVRRVVRKIRMLRPVLWLNPHTAVHMAGCMGESGIIYDVTDDWTAHAQSELLRQRTQRQDAELCRKADAVIVCSQKLLEMKEKLSQRVTLIPNGVDVEHYAAVTDAHGVLPPEATQWPKPVFGYTGTVHPDRVDVELVEALSQRMGGGSLVFVGPNHLSKLTVERLTARENIFFVGPVPYERIPDYMRAFDVCIVPHRVSAFTESLNPIKLWEYLAAGKPIVSTDIAGFRDYPQLVSIAKSVDEFICAMLAGLGEGDSNRKLRQQEAGGHSWKARVDQIEQVLLGIAGNRLQTAGV